MTAYAEQALRFGPFTLYRERKLLLDGDKPVRLGARSWDLLVALVERAGEVVSKQELMASMWPQTSVEESGLRVHVAALRTLLGEGEGGLRYVVNVPGRGYCFIAPVQRLAPAAPPPGAGAPAAHNLPGQLTRMVGRAEMIETVAVQLASLRFISIVGAAGMGKTSLALAVAERRLPYYADGVCLLDLGRLGDTAELPGALAAALDVPATAALPELLLQLGAQQRRMLLVLDSCERLAEAAATLAVQLLKRMPGLHVLVTSREPLRAEGEWVQRLGSLGLPPPDPVLTAAQARQYPAVQLFVERAIASVDSFELSDANAAAVAEICRRLDGMPLAIELAAARVQAFGAHGLLRALDDRFRLLCNGQRTALPRHRTLEALLDWSHETLCPAEQRLLNRLAAFRGDFTLAEVQALAGAEQLSEAQLVETLVSLVLKSLVVAEVGAGTVRYRLLETTRAYALQKAAG